MLRKIRLIFVCCIIVIVAVFFVYTRSLYRVPVLMYHSVNPETNPGIAKLIVSPQDFSRQMHFLKERHYNVITLKELSRLMRDKKSIPRKTVAITFDDGFKDNYIYAYPVLKELGLPATIFVIYNEVGRREGDRLSWDEIREMQASGLVSIGSHALGPEPLVNIKSEPELRKQIIDSRKMLEKKIGVPVDGFCYVGGLFTPHIKELAREAGYEYAVATTLGKDYSAGDVYAIERVRIPPSSGNLLDFRIRISGYYNSFREHKR